MNSEMCREPKELLSDSTSALVEFSPNAAMTGQKRYVSACIFNNREDR